MNSATERTILNFQANVTKQLKAGTITGNLASELQAIGVAALAHVKAVEAVPVPATVVANVDATTLTLALTAALQTDTVKLAIQEAVLGKGFLGKVLG